MGGLAAGLAAAIGGAGTAASKYGEQLRGLLENRREAMAGQLLNLANTEIEPNTRNAHIQGAADLLSGKPMGPIAQNIIGAVQKKSKDNEVLGNALQSIQGGNGAIPPVQPVGPKLNIPASMSGASPVQPSQQSTPAPNMTPVPQAQQAPTPVQAPQAQPQMPSLNTPSQMPGGLSADQLMQTPAGRTMMQPLMANYAELERQRQFTQMELGYKKDSLQQFKLSPYYSNLPDIQKGELEVWASTPGQQLPPIGAAAMYMPRVMSPRLMGKDAPPGSVVAGTNSPVDPMGQYRWEYNPMMGQNMFFPVAPETSLTQTPEGMQISNRQTGSSIAPVQGAVPPSANTYHQEVTPGGDVGFITPSQAEAGRQMSIVPGAVSSPFASPRMSINPSGQQEMFNAAGIQGTPGGMTPLPTGMVPPAMLATNTTSSQSVPGQLPTTTTSVRTRGGAGATPAIPPPGQAIPPVQAPSGGQSALMKQKYDDWASGKYFPTGKDLTAVQQYAAANKLSTPTQATSQMRNVAAQAQLVDEQTPYVLSEIDRLKSQLGPIAGRFNKFMQGDIGMDNPEFAGLRADLLMYSSAVALMHARGRLPENLRQEFDTSINNPGQDFNNLKSTISRIGDWTKNNMKVMQGGGGMGTSQPKVGDIEDGYRFKGGDAGKKENWEQVLAPIKK